MVKWWFHLCCHQGFAKHRPDEDGDVAGEDEVGEEEAPAHGPDQPHQVEGAEHGRGGETHSVKQGRGQDWASYKYQASPEQGKI